MKGLFQCPPWARSFWAFSPYLNHMRKFCYRKSSAKKMQTSAMKACFQIAECSFSSAKIAKKNKLNKVVLNKVV